MPERAIFFAFGNLPLAVIAGDGSLALTLPSDVYAYPESRKLFSPKPVGRRRHPGDAGYKSLANGIYVKNLY